jgi:hypothetical protein
MRLSIACDGIHFPVAARVSRAILLGLFAADTAASTGEKESRGYKSREAHVLARIHLKVEHE